MGKIDTIREALDVIEDLFELIDAANLNDDELETLNGPGGLADRTEQITTDLTNLLVKLEKEKNKDI